MADSDLDAIRARRLAELQAQQAQRQEAEGEAASRQQEMKNTMLAQILGQDARARLSSIALVKPEKASQIEQILLRMAQTGQIAQKLSEAELVGLLEKVNQSTQPKKTTVKFERRRLDSDDDDDF